jgi:ParB family chromosome partitioning protein
MTVNSETVPRRIPEAERDGEALPLTRTALAAWPRWRAASGEGRRRIVAQWLSPGEEAILIRLEGNLAACGPPETWFNGAGTASERARPERLARLLAGLRVAKEAVPDLARACVPGDTLRQNWLAQDLARFLARPPPPAARNGKNGTGPVDAAASDLPALRAEAIRIDRILPSALNPRRPPGAEELASLADSIREVGIIEPVIVRPTDREGLYELVAGGRRWRAAIAAGLSRIPAVVRVATDEEVLTLMLAENRERRDLDPLEEAEGIRRLIDLARISQAGAGRRIGRSQGYVGHALSLLRLPAAVQERLRRGEISPSHAEVLVRLVDRPAEACAVAARIAAEGITSRDLERVIPSRDPATRQAARWKPPTPAEDPGAEEERPAPTGPPTGALAGAAPAPRPVDPDGAWLNFRRQLRRFEERLSASFPRALAVRETRLEWELEEPLRIERPGDTARTGAICGLSLRIGPDGAAWELRLADGRKVPLAGRDGGAAGG